MGQSNIQVHNVGFRRLGVYHRAIKTEMIRCHETYALMDAGDGTSGYVLERNQPRRQSDDASTLFYIYRKFHYGIESSEPPEELPSLFYQPSQHTQPADRDLQTPRHELPPENVPPLVNEPQ